MRVIQLLIQTKLYPISRRNDIRYPGKILSETKLYPISRPIYIVRTETKRRKFADPLELGNRNSSSCTWLHEYVVRFFCGGMLYGNPFQAFGGKYTTEFNSAIYLGGSMEQDFRGALAGSNAMAAPSSAK